MNPRSNDYQPVPPTTKKRRRTEQCGIAETYDESSDSTAPMREQPFFHDATQGTDSGSLRVSEGPISPRSRAAYPPMNPSSYVQDLAPIQPTPLFHHEDCRPRPETQQPKKAGRRKINIEFIRDKGRRHITFSKRKSGLMKKAYELSVLTGTQLVVLVASETGHVYTYATSKLQPLITRMDSRSLIQTCLYSSESLAPNIAEQPQTPVGSFIRQPKQPMFGQQEMEDESPPNQHAGLMRMSGHALSEQVYGADDIKGHGGQTECTPFADYQRMNYSDYAQMRQYTSPPSGGGQGQAYFQGQTAAPVAVRQGFQFPQHFVADVYGQQMQGERQGGQYGMERPVSSHARNGEYWSRQGRVMEGDGSMGGQFGHGGEGVGEGGQQNTTSKMAHHSNNK